MQIPETFKLIKKYSAEPTLLPQFDQSKLSGFLSYSREMFGLPNYHYSGANEITMYQNQSDNRYHILFNGEPMCNNPLEQYTNAFELYYCNAYDLIGVFDANEIFEKGKVIAIHKDEERNVQIVTFFSGDLTSRFRTEIKILDDQKPLFGKINPERNRGMTCIKFANLYEQAMELHEDSVMGLSSFNDKSVSLGCPYRIW